MRRTERLLERPRGLPGFVLGPVVVALAITLATSLARADCTPSPYCPNVCLPPLCNSYDQPYDCRPAASGSANDVVALEYLGYRAKDFTLFESNGVFHLFYILQFGNEDTSSTRFGHDVSDDLVHWKTLAPVLPVRADGWDSKHVWSPFVVQADSFYLFYTGVDSDGHEAIGLAASTDLEDWHRRNTPIFSCAQAPWAWCDGSSFDFRDPFVMADPDSAGRWLMFYATRLADTTAVPGLARSAGDFGAWRDAGPLWRKETNWFDDARQFESPHVFFHDGRWFLFYTTNSSQPVEFQSTTGSPGDSLAWGNWNRLANLDCVDIPITTATEYLHDPVTGEDLFADVNFGRIEIRRMRWWQDSTYFSLLPPGDRVPPGTVTDLRAMTGRSTAVIQWTAPGGDGDYGRASSYDLRYSVKPLDPQGWPSGSQQATTATPDTVGRPECVEIRDLHPGTRYWFAVRSYDRAGNPSGLSNVVSATTRGPRDSEVMCAYEDTRREPPYIAPGVGDDYGATPGSPPADAAVDVRPVFPNPAHGVATLHFDLPRSAVLTVEIFEPTGRRVRTVMNAWEAAGPHSLPWDGRDAAGSTLPPGVYLYRWAAGAARGQGKIELVR